LAVVCREWSFSNRAAFGLCWLNRDEEPTAFKETCTPNTVVKDSIVDERLDRIEMNPRLILKEGYEFPID
jgi:hypothetical protein